MTKTGKRRAPVILTAVLLVLAGLTQAWAATPLAGRLVSLEGQVTVMPGSERQWVPARPKQDLFVGDAVQTGPDSRAAILCVDDCQIKLNANTILVLKQVAPSPRLAGIIPAAGGREDSLYQVPRGEIWLSNKNPQFRGKLETPAVSISPRGTEITVIVAPNGTTNVTLLEGQVCLANPLGELCMLPGEEGVTIPGREPTKRVLAQPQDAVQWVLSYPGTLSYRDLPLGAPGEEGRTPAAGPDAAAIREGEQAYDRGDLDAARAAAETALRLNPASSRAVTLLGWVHLQRQAPAEAEAAFRRAKQPDAMTVIGLALARERQGDQPGAYQLIKSARAQLRPHSLLTAMTGYFALMVGKAEEARALFTTAAGQPPPSALPQAFLAQVELVQGRKAAAQAAAGEALSRNPGSPLAQFSMGLVHLAYFRQDAARSHFEQALKLDPRFVSAYVFLARVWLGSDFLDRAQRVIQQALRLAPQEAEVLSLAGFVRLAFRDFDGARRYFLEAVKREQGLGEPHLGLAICEFRSRRLTEGVDQMLTATLLDPRVSQFQSELGKALYQVRSFTKALETYDYAKTLDPKDPTPYLYKGIALTDLNRPGEAIQEINRSIELNDNVALFRSRLGLDQDLAVRNAGLARAYQQLGLTEWGLSKAVTAVKYDPFNSAAHLFLRDTISASRAGFAAPFLTSGLLLGAANTESALFRVLAPANQATYRSLQFRGTEALGLTRDYAPMFEMPFARVGISGGLGAAEGSKLRQEQQGVAYGGIPGAAFEAFGQFVEDPQGPPTTSNPANFSGRNRFYNVEANAKWEPTVKGTLTGLIQYVDQNPTSQFQNLPSSPAVNTDINLRGHLYELAYYHRFNPQAGFLAYFAYNDLPFRLVQHNPFGFQTSLFNSFDQELYNVQMQQHLIIPFWGQHSLVGGFNYFSANVGQTFRVDVAGSTVLNLQDYPPFWSYSFYLQDYWRLRQDLVLELGLWKTFQKDPAGFPGNFYTSLWSPRFGLNYQFSAGNTQHVLRAMAERHLTSHLAVQPILVPAEIASFPWTLDFASGTEVRQAGAAWEAQWDPLTFTTLRLNAFRVSTPFISAGEPFWQTWQRYQASLVLNRILTTSLGLAVGVAGKRVVPDLSFQGSDNLRDYTEFNAFVTLAYLHRTGWLARVTPLLVQQYGDTPAHEADNPFVILNLALGKEFPNKRGFALFEVQNLFNRQPFYSLEPRRDLEFTTSRRFLFRLGFYF